MTIYFGGVEMPAPKLNGGLVETYENVWSADTGRNSAGRMPVVEEQIKVINHRIEDLEEFHKPN